MAESPFLKLLRKNFSYEPTPDQQSLMLLMTEFYNDTKEKKSFILRGYAGTGKTTFIQAIAKTYSHFDYSVVLLAPTGRAAKVMNDYTGRSASTLHRRLYDMAIAKGGSLSVRAAKNKSPKTVFIVDEASMIAAGDDNSLFKGRNILRDLFKYVYSQEDCFLIFIGDTAQLPPVGEEDSPALDADYIEREFKMKVYYTELKDVVRHAEESGILMNATALRILINRNAREPVFKSEGFKDIERVDGNQLMQTLMDAYEEDDPAGTLVVCRSNKQANRYNQFIRKELLNFYEPLSAGDRLMVVKNNYHWLEQDSEAGFIANGDIIRIKEILRTEEKYGFHYADVRMELPDYPLQGSTEVKLILDTISSESSALSSEQNKMIFEAINEKHKKIKKAPDRLRAVYTDPYYNALQVKFGYAITCHKAQGGQWPSVFVDSGFVNETSSSTELLRWLYTAFTRASKKLVLVNMHERYFRN